MPNAEEIDSALARQIQSERQARGWSLAEVAERSGVSKAMLSKIERGETSPTAALLARLASAFDLTLAGLLLRLHPESGRVSRAVDQPQWTDPDTGYVRRQVLAVPEHPIELATIELPAGQRVGFPASTYAFIKQAIWVRSGQLTIVEGEDRHLLGPGDCLAFGPPSKVVIANETDDPCSYLVALQRR